MLICHMLHSSEFYYDLAERGAVSLLAWNQMLLSSHYCTVPTPSTFSKLEHDCHKGPCHGMYSINSQWTWLCAHCMEKLRQGKTTPWSVFMLSMNWHFSGSKTCMLYISSSVLTFVQQHDHLLKHFCEVHVVITVFLK